MKKVVVSVLAITVLFAFLLGCAVTYVPDSPPPLKSEVKPPPPGHKAAWVDGHWKWSHGRYVWVPGHWVKNPHGKWVAGHWEKRPRGWVWVKGHWR